LPILNSSKATGLAVLKILLAENVPSPRFWIPGVLLFGLFFAASRGGTVLKSVVFLGSYAHGFGARLFECCDVRVSLHSFQIPVTILLSSQDVVHERNFFAASAFQHSRRSPLA
jgi:hypothetical protein